MKNYLQVQSLEASIFISNQIVLAGGEVQKARDWKTLRAAEANLAEWAAVADHYEEFLFDATVHPEVCPIRLEALTEALK